MEIRFFLAGIMQGSQVAERLHAQGYRQQLRRMLLERYPRSDIYDPRADHRASLTYDDAIGRQVFLKHNAMCADVDVVIAFVPAASMGTAIEMWEAHRHGQCVITISPLVHNWVIKFCSDANFPDLEAFETALQSGHLDPLIRRVAESEHRNAGGAPPE